MRVTSGASASLTIARTRSKRTGESCRSASAASIAAWPLIAAPSREGDADGHRIAEGAGHRRPAHRMRHQLVERAAVGIAFDMRLDAHRGEADGLLAEIADAPDRGDVDVAFEFQLDPAQ